MRKRNGAPYSKFHVDLSEKGKLDRTACDYKTGDTIRFDSLLEKQFYEENIIPGMKDGEIIDYDLQKKYQIQPSFKHNGKSVRAIEYWADFWVLYKDGSEKVFDVKGNLIDNIAKMKLKMMYYKYPDLNYDWITYVPHIGWIEYFDFQKNKKSYEQQSRLIARQKKGNSEGRLI